jgi:hypothetical protein
MHMTTLLMQIPIYQAGPRLFCKMPDITSPYVQESFASSRDFKAASSENIPHRNSYYIYLFIASSSTNTYCKYSTPSVLKYLLFDHSPYSKKLCKYIVVCILNLTVPNYELIMLIRFVAQSCTHL